MKALIELEFYDAEVYGDNNDEPMSNEEYREFEGVVEGAVVDAFNSVLADVYDELGINDLDITDITDEDSGSFTYVLSTGFPKNVAFQAFDLVERALKKFLAPFKDYTDAYRLQRLAWKEYDDGEYIECPHEYETVHFIAVQSDIREIKTCKHCKESIAKLVKLVE